MDIDPQYLIIIVLILSITLIIMNVINNSNKYKQENDEYKKILFRNADYKCKGLEYYQENDIQKLNRIYRSLPPELQDKLVRQAEQLERTMINQRYIK